MTLTPEKVRKKGIIMAKAKDLFIKNGYKSTLMSEVATGTGFTKRTIYKYFETKNDLYQAIVTTAFEKFNKHINDELLNYNSLHSIDKIEIAGTGYRKFVLENPGDFKLTVEYESLENTEHYQTISAIRCREEGDKIVKLMFEMIDEGIKKGELNDELLPNQALALILSTSQGVMNYVSTKQFYLQNFLKFKPSELIGIHFKYIMQILKRSNL